MIGRMTTPLIFAALWVVAATLVALLPMRWQFVPGFGLLVGAPVVIVWIGAVHGGLWAIVGLAGFVSMFRRPLWFLLRRMLSCAKGRV